MTNPLHPPIPHSLHSGYSALSGAMSYSGDQSPSFRRLPQEAYTPNSKWHGSTGRASGLHAPVSFDYVGGNRRGVKMRDLTARDCTPIISGGQDRVMTDAVIQRINLRILWPGYPASWARSIEIFTSSGPVTRARLGQLVAQNFSRFIELNSSVSCASPEWSVGPGKIRFDQLYLVSLYNSFEESWQAEVLVNFC